MLETFTGDMFNLNYFFQVTELAHYLIGSKLYDEDGEGIWILRLSVLKQEKHVYLSDNLISSYLISYEKCINQLYKWILNLLAFFLVKLSRTASSKLN